MNNIDPNTIKLVLAVVAGGLAIFAPTLWEKLKPFWPKAKAMFGFGDKKTDDEDEVEGLEAYSLHEIVEYLIADRKALKDDVGVQLVGTLGKHLYDLRLEQKK